MKPEKAVLYLSYDGLTDPLGQSQILPYLSGLSDAGYTITIVSFEKPDRFSMSEGSISRFCKEKNLLWEPLVYHKHPPVASTVYDLYKLRKKVIDLHRLRNFSIVHCRSYVTALVGLWLKTNYGVRFIFDMRGFWADERIEGGIWHLKNPLHNFIYRFFKKKEKEFLTKADHIVSLTHNAKQEIESWGIKTPVTVIPTCVDLKLFDPSKITLEERNSLKDDLGIKADDFVLIYLGSWGTWYLTREMLGLFSMLRSKNSKARFLILSTDPVNLTGYADTASVVIKPVKRTDVPMYISIASASVAFIKPSFSKKASSATKIGELLSMNIPVLTNSGWGDIDRSEYAGVKVINDFSSASLSKAADDLIQTSGTRLDFLIHENHPLSLSSGIHRYLHVYENIR